MRFWITFHYVEWKFLYWIILMCTNRIYKNVHLYFQNIIRARNKPFIYKSEGKDIISYYKTMSSYAGIPRIQENILFSAFLPSFFPQENCNIHISNPLTKEETDIMFHIDQCPWPYLYPALQLKFGGASSTDKAKKRIYLNQP